MSATDNSQNPSSNELRLKGIESLKLKVASVPADVNVNTKAAKEIDHEILMDVASQLATFFPEMLAFKSSFETFASEMRNEMTVLKTEMKAIQDENSCIKKENTEIKKENASLKHQLLSNEINQTQKSIIVKGLPPLNCREDDETNELLQESFDKILTQMKLSGNVQVADIYRLKSKQKKSIATGGSLFSPVKVDFQSMIHKRQFFKNIKNLNGSIFNEIQISQCVVKSLEKDYKDLDKQAFDLRKASPGTKCKIIISKQKYKLIVKTPTDKTFSEYKPQ